MGLLFVGLLIVAARWEASPVGLLIVMGWLSEGGNPANSLVLWILLAAAVGLTWWECRERGYRLKVMLWWMSFVAITHVVGYLILRFAVRPPQRA